MDTGGWLTTNVLHAVTNFSQIQFDVDGFAEREPQTAEPFPKSIISDTCGAGSEDANNKDTSCRIQAGRWMSQRRVTRDQLAIVVKLSNESKKEKSVFSYLFIRT